MTLIVIGLLAALALVFVAYPLVSNRRHLYYLDDMLGLGEQKKLNYLYAKRAQIYDNIKDLEMEHEMGKLSEEDFARLRNDLLIEAQGVVKEIDHAQMKREIEDLIEADVKKHRKLSNDRA